MCRDITALLHSTTRILRDRIYWVIRSPTSTSRYTSLSIMIEELERFRYDNFRFWSRPLANCGEFSRSCRRLYLSSRRSSRRDPESPTTSNKMSESNGVITTGQVAKSGCCQGSMRFKLPRYFLSFIGGLLRMNTMNFDKKNTDGAWIPYTT